MTKVNFYKTEVKYTGCYDDYSWQDFFEMAKAKQDKGIDCFDRCEDIPDSKAHRIDDEVVVFDNPCNKTVYVEWAYIVEE